MQEQNKPVNNPAVEEKKQRSLWQEAWRRFRKNRMAMIGLAFILLLVIISISTLVIDAATHNPALQRVRCKAGFSESFERSQC